MNSENEKKNTHEVKVHCISNRKFFNTISTCNHPQNVESRYLAKTSSSRDLAGKIVFSSMK
jgi:hypothetical protein